MGKQSECCHLVQTKMEMHLAGWEEHFGYQAITSTPVVACIWELHIFTCILYTMCQYGGQFYSSFMSMVVLC